MTNESEDVPKIQSIDLEPTIGEFDRDIQQFKESISEFRFGKLTPDIFKTVQLHIKGEKLSLFELGQFIPVSGVQIELYLYEKENTKQVMQVL